MAELKIAGVDAAKVLAAGDVTKAQELTAGAEKRLQIDPTKVIYGSPLGSSMPYLWLTL